MTDTLLKPDRAQLQQWLKDARVEYSECGECEGLHLAALQGIEGVIDSRLFLERYGLLLTTEIEIRPMALHAPGRGPRTHQHGLPDPEDIPRRRRRRHAAAGDGRRPADPGRTDAAQCAHFVSSVMDATRQLSAECLQLDYLFAEGAARGIAGKKALH
jgi:hypothetical protein